jgi:hypothetical protein
LHAVKTFAAKRLAVEAAQVSLNVAALRGGLEAAAVARCEARATATVGTRVPRITFVVKRLDGIGRREGAVYRTILGPPHRTIAPELLDVQELSGGVSYLYMSYVRSVRAWPWTETAVAGQVLETLADLHTSIPASQVAALEPAWDYETELSASAASTLEMFERAVREVDLAWLSWGRGALRRLAEALPSLRRAVVTSEPFGPALIHGDVHSGNVALTGSGKVQHVVMFDWARARVGSSMEDVASWLESLGYWEPEAKRRHNTLLRRYLVARGLPSELSRAVRDTYWLAAASNVLAGALRYQLAVAGDRAKTPSRPRATAAHAARDHLRVLRRADAVWRS